jgi:hypothetical protein
MAATVIINEWNGTTGSPTKTDKTSGTIRYRQSNSATVDAANPLSKPSAGSTWSFDKWMQLRITGTGPTGSITNLQFYTDGTNSYGTGITAWIKTTNIASGSFTTPVNAGTDTGYSDQFGFNSGAAKNMDAVTAGAPYSGTNVDIGDFSVLHMTLATTVSAPQNPTSSETLTWSWDET